jgi:D-alanyl-D-alanine carboxypeptidase (penicillin-binding protein 5/6)
MRWRWWAVGLCFVLSRPLLQETGAAPARPPAAASILIDGLTGETLLEDGADTPRPAGSLNQLMVLLLAVERAALGALPLETPVTITAAAAPISARDGGRPRGKATAASAPPVLLKSDRTYVLSDLLKALVMSPADSAAAAVAEKIAGSIPACLELMNARAQRAGMVATRYSSLGGRSLNPSAGPDTTTARDMGRLAQALVRHRMVLEWASVSGLPFDRGSILLRNVNQLIGAVPGVDGLQVSSGGDGGYSIVATAQRRSLRLIAVVLGAPDSTARYRRAAELLEWGFAHYERLEVAKRGEHLNLPIRILNGSVSQITPVAGQTVSVLSGRDQERDLQVRYQFPAVLMAPVQRHQPVGEVIVEEKGKLIAVIPVVSPQSVASTSVLSAAVP